MTNPDWLDKIEQREQKATEGPSLDTAKMVFANTILQYPEMATDMRFVLRLIDEVAHARTDVPRLCKEVKELRSVIRGKTFPTESAEVRSWMMPRRAIR